jgi:hypothetical protein
MYIRTTPTTTRKHELFLPLAYATQQNTVTTTELAKPHGGQHVVAEKHVGSRHVGAHISRTDGDILIPKKDSGRAENPLQLVGTRFSSSSDRYFSIPRRGPMYSSS